MVKTRSMAKTRSNRNSDKGRSRKKLRASGMDLKIVVGEGADQREYWYYSPTITSQSHFIDIMLASRMRESISGVIKLPDLAPEDWDRMMKFLDVKNVKTRQKPQKMTLDDAVELLPLYDKYEFRQGLAACEESITDSLNEKMKRPEAVCQEDFDLLILLIEAMDAGGLSSSTVESALKLIRPFVKNPLAGCGRSLLSSDQVEQLVPLLQRAERSIHSIHQDSLFSDWTEEFVNNPMFPRIFVKQWELWNASTLLKEEIKGVHLNGVFDDDAWLFEGIYGSRILRGGNELVFVAWKCVPLPENIDDDDDFRFFGAVIRKRQNEFQSAEASGCWTICLLGDEDKEIDGFEYYDILEAGLSTYPMWIAPKSQNMVLPPKDGWIPAKNEMVDRPHLSFPESQPKIKYMFSELF